MKKIIVIGFFTACAGGSIFAIGENPSNTKYGENALKSLNENMLSNSAFGFGALRDTTGNNNSAFGARALSNLTDGRNVIAVGVAAGAGLQKGRANIYVGSAAGAAEESQVIRIGSPKADMPEDTQKSCYIAGIYNAEMSGNAKIVVINEQGKLATIEVSADELQNLIKSKKQ